MQNLRENASLIFTVLNEEESILTFLDSISAQTSEVSQIVCVDGGSDDKTVQILKKWAEGQETEVTVYEGQDLSISEGRNLAIAHSKCGRILVADAGTQLDPNWVSSMIFAFDSNPDSAVISGWFKPLKAGYWQNLIGAATTPRLEEIDPASFLPSHRSVGFLKSAWASVGGYPEWLDYCEDLVLDLKFKEAGFKFTFAPGAIALWSARPSLAGFFKQYYRYSRGDGKANLWKTRHLARYVFYCLFIATFLGGLIEANIFLLASLALLGARSFGYSKRVWLSYRVDVREAIHLLLSVPLISLVGDLAKMLGYPVGVFWRINNLKRKVGN